MEITAGRWLIIVAALLVVAAINITVGGTPAPFAARPASVPGSKPIAASSTRPSGKWSCWLEDRYFGPRAATPKAVWFAGWRAGHIWRYDLKSQTIEAFCALDGLPLDEDSLERIVGASDERCAIFIHRHSQTNGGIFLWTPGDGWRALPLLAAGNYVRDIAFDLNDKLVVLSTSNVDGSGRVSRFDGKKWSDVCTVPPSGAIVPLKDGFMVISGVFPSMGTPYGIAYYVLESDPSKITTTQISGCRNEHFPYFRLGGKTLCMPVGAYARVSCSEKAYNLTSEGFVECLAGKYLGFDLKAGGLVNCQVVETTNDRLRVKPDTPDAPTIDVPYDCGQVFEPFRDPNGHLWRGRQRWDGREWKTFSSGREIPYPLNYGEDLVRLSDDGSSWFRVNPALPAGAFCYDPVKHTAWVRTSLTGKGEWQLIRFGGDKREVLRSIPYDHDPGVPQFQTADGDWWWFDYTKAVRRLTAEGFQDYPSGDCISLALSPRGTVWRLMPGDSYARYDPRTDSFVPGEPWEDFSFDLGKWKLAHFPNSNNLSLYQKTDAGWAPFRTPFSKWPAGAPGMTLVHGDRLLVNVADAGVMEYNATLDKWARLTETSAFARFDHRGRCILSGWGMLVYDGDPWANYKPDIEGEAIFAGLLKQMDDSKFAVRERASREMAKELDRFRFQITSSAEDASLSPEVRARLRALLPGDDTPAPVPPALFRTMHPLLSPPEP